MTSDSVRLLSIGVRMTAPLMRSAAARISSIVGGCIIGPGISPRGLAVHLGVDNAMPLAMHKPLLALAAALLASPALADTMVYNVNGIQVGPDGNLQEFQALQIGEDGK